MLSLDVEVEILAIDEHRVFAKTIVAEDFISVAHFILAGEREVEIGIVTRFHEGRIGAHRTACHRDAADEDGIGKFARNSASEAE